MKDVLGTTGLILTSLFSGKKASPEERVFTSVSDVEASPLDESLTCSGPDFPDLSEVDVVRHSPALHLELRRRHRYLSPGLLHHEIQPENQHKQASLPGFCGAHPLLPKNFPRGF